MPSGTCSCLSGFGSTEGTIDCSIPPPASCIASYMTGISATANAFGALIETNFTDNTIAITIATPLDQTTYVNAADLSQGTVDPTTTAYSTSTIITFGSCIYPEPTDDSTLYWMKPAVTGSDCLDVYELSLPWPIAKDMCGFTYNAIDSSWEATVTITRTFSVPFNTSSGSGFTTRNETVSQLVSVSFPSSVVVSSTANVTGPIAVSAQAITLLEYQGGLGQWEYNILALVTQPYKFASNFSVALSGPLASSGRLLTAMSSITNLTLCHSNLDAGCRQTISLFFSGCDALNGTVTLTLTPICSGGQDVFTCIEAGLGDVVITAQVAAAASCGLIDNLHLQAKSLASYSNSDMTIASTSYSAADVAYFNSSISSNDSVITQVVVRSVCMILNPQLGNTACAPVAFNQISAVDSLEPSFSLVLSQTRALTNATAGQTFTVQATVSITWLGDAKRTEALSAVTTISTTILVHPHSLSSTASTTASPDLRVAENTQITQTTVNNEQWKMVLIGSVSAVCGVAVFAVIVLAIFLYNRKKRRDAELNFNFSSLVD